MPAPCSLVLCQPFDSRRPFSPSPLHSALTAAQKVEAVDVVEEGDVAHNQRGASRQPVGKARGCRAGGQVGAGKAGKGPERVRVGRTVAGDAARTGRQLGPAWRCTGKQGRQGSTGSTRTCGKHAVDAAGAAVGRHWRPQAGGNHTLPKRPTAIAAAAAGAAAASCCRRCIHIKVPDGHAVAHKQPLACTHRAKNAQLSDPSQGTMPSLCFMTAGSGAAQAGRRRLTRRQLLRQGASHLWLSELRHLLQCCIYCCRRLAIQ